MNTASSSDLSLPGSSSNSRILSQSPPNPLADLSLSELSISRKDFGPQTPKNTEPPYDYDQTPNGHAGPVGEGEEAREQGVHVQARTREEKLQHDLFVLRRLNAAFAIYADALRETQSATERVSGQLKQTDALLNKYANVLDKSDAVARMIFDPRWQGAEADEEQVHDERLHAEERARAEEARLAAEEEARRAEEAARAERERAARDAQEREAAAAAARPSSVRGSSSGVRGVRGTRASMRARGVARGASTTGLGRGRTSGPDAVKPGLRAPASRGVPRKS